MAHTRPFLDPGINPLCYFTQGWVNQPFSPKRIVVLVNEWTNSRCREWSLISQPRTAWLRFVGEKTRGNVSAQ